jgi:hypothetical protein
MLINIVPHAIKARMSTHIHLTDYYEVFVATKLPNGKELALYEWAVDI